MFKPFFKKYQIYIFFYIIFLYYFQNDYQKRYNEVEKNSFTIITNRCDTEQQKHAQKIASDVC